MEPRRLHAPSLGPLSHYQTHSPLSNTGICGDHRQTHHAIAQPVMEIRLAGGGKAVNLDHLNSLSEAKSLDIADVICPKR